MNGRIAACFLAIVGFSHSPLVAQQVGDCVGIFFYRSDSQESQKMSGVIHQAIQDGWAIRSSDVVREPDVAIRMKVNTLPTLLLLRGGKEVDRVLGGTDYREVQRRMLLASSPDNVRTPGRPLSVTPIVRGQSQPAVIPLASSGSGISQPIRASSETRAISTPSDPAGATVRIRVDEPSHQDIGTGTIIDSFQGEALVLTCGHLFRDTQGRAPILVETFFGGVPKTYHATLIDFRADDTDIGLISFRADGPVPTARLMDHRESLREGDQVFSWGCDNGTNPTRRDSHITKLNRYVGVPNVEVMGKPVQGRSGGGLFNNKGELIGVCYAADDQLNEGLYNAPEVVYQQLMKLGLRRLFEYQTNPAVVTASASTSAGTSVGRSESTQWGNSETRPTTPPRRLIVMVEEAGRTEQIEIKNPSPVLMDAINSQRLIR